MTRAIHLDPLELYDNAVQSSAARVGQPVRDRLECPMYRAAIAAFKQQPNPVVISMFRLRNLCKLGLAFSTIWAASNIVCAQHGGRASADSSEFGPVMRAYLGYLKNEQEVVDDRVSRREITSGYYQRNSNRIRALREMAIQLVRQSNNDYVPELEAVTQDEFGTLFESRPSPVAFHSNVIIANKFRYLGLVRAGEVFYLFARLDPYEQAALMQKTPDSASGSTEIVPKGQRVGETSARPRRVVPR